MGSQMLLDWINTVPNKGHASPGLMSMLTSEFFREGTPTGGLGEDGKLEEERLEAMSSEEPQRVCSGALKNEKYVVQGT